MHLMPVSKHEAIQNLLALTNILMANGDRDAVEKVIDLVYLLCDKVALSLGSPDVAQRLAVVDPIILDDIEYVPDA